VICKTSSYRRSTNIKLKRIKTQTVILIPTRYSPGRRSRSERTRRQQMIFNEMGSWNASTRTADVHNQSMSACRPVYVDDRRLCRRTARHCPGGSIWTRREKFKTRIKSRSPSDFVRHTKTWSSCTRAVRLWWR